MIKLSPFNMTEVQCCDITLNKPFQFQSVNTTLLNNIFIAIKIMKISLVKRRQMQAEASSTQNLGNLYDMTSNNIFHIYTFWLRKQPQ